LNDISLILILRRMCTTILPSIFVLVGFTIAAIVATTRNLPPITLDLSAYNPGVTAKPVNPVPFNSPDNPYTCQPGICSYQTPVVLSPETYELYTYCGTQANLGVDVDTRQVGVSDNSCTVDESADILRTIDGFQGAALVETDVETVTTVSGISLVEILHLMALSLTFVSSKHGAVIGRFVQ
jgi:hypothetical protein